MLGASPEGEGLYGRFGFEVVERRELRLSEWEGGDGMGVTTHGELILQ